MKTKLLLIAVTAIGLIHLIGCATPNPAAATDPKAPPYLPNQYIGSLSNQIQQIADAVAPVNPYAGITNLAVKGGFTIAGAIAGAIAGYKNRNAVVNNMAQSVVKANAHAAVLDHASDTGSFGAIADAINNQLAANQSPSGRPTA